jgi:hypothetical protein
MARTKNATLAASIIASSIFDLRLALVRVATAIAY